MEELKDKTISRIKEKKKILERELNVQININKNRIMLEGEELDKFVAKKVLRALDRNFKIKQALILKEDDCILEDVNIKNMTKRKDISTIRARVIGRNARTIKLLNDISGCYIILHDSTVSVLGQNENVERTVLTIKKLVQGSDHSKVYTYLEKEMKDLKKMPQDIGLKESFKNNIQEGSEKENNKKS